MDAKEKAITLEDPEKERLRSIEIDFHFSLHLPPNP